MEKENKKDTKLCKHCKTEIPKDAKVCPNCRKKQKGIGKWIAIAVVVVHPYRSDVRGRGINRKK